MPHIGFSTAYEQHRAGLRQVFCDWLVEQHPRDVLDVGAGKGALLRLLRERDVPARGLDPLQDHVDEGMADGLDLAQGKAWPLRQESRSVDWVCLRHMLHHLVAPERATLEAIRVARTGVMVAEPIAWDALPAHRITARFQSFLRAADRERGLVHGDDIPPGTLTALFPPDWTVELRVHAPLLPLSAEDAEVMIRMATAGQPLPAAQEEIASSFIEWARLGLLAAPGTVMVCARRPVR